MPQVFQVAKSLCHHARFRAAMVGGGSRMKTQEDSLKKAIDLIVATPGRLLMHIEQGNMAYGDLKYVVSISFYLHLFREKTNNEFAEVIS